MRTPTLHAKRHLLVAAVLPAFLAGCGWIASHEKTETLNMKHVAGSAVDVETANGSITVIKSDRKDVEIVATIKAVSEERMKDAKVIAERRDDKTLVVRVEWPDGNRRGSEGCSFDIRVPDAVNVRMKSSNGKLHTADLSGEADLRTSNGAITIADHDGPIDAQSSNGKITVSGATKSVKVRTSNGGLKIGMASGSKGPINARTSNGSVTLKLGPAFVGTMTLKTSNGSVKFDDLGSAEIVSQGRKDAKVNFGDGGEDSTVRTSNGSIRVNGGR